MFRAGYMLNVEYECPCSFPSVYNCKMHVLNNMETPNTDHALKQNFVESCEKTRQAILLPKCDSIEDLNRKFKEEEIMQRNFRKISVGEDLEEKDEILDISKSLEERKLKGSLLACENDFSVHKKSVTQAYLDIVSTYQQIPSLFHLERAGRHTNLLIYNTEIESQASIFLKTSQPLGWGTCIAQLPNGKLFCFGNYPFSGITLLIDENYRVEELPSGTVCTYSSAIYFNNNVYCFGGVYNANSLTLSSRFDLGRNQWNKLTPLPKVDRNCNSIIFNGSILISGYENKNLLRYSIDSNSFSKIPYDFEKQKIKTLLNAERLYLIKCQGSIYESEIGSDTTWRQITSNSTIDFLPNQTYIQYNKEEIYIRCTNIFYSCCFKFNLSEKRLIKCLKRSISSS